MATPITPAGVKVQNNLKRIFVPTLDRAAPSLAALTGTDALEVTNILYADTGWYQSTSNTGEAPRRVGTAKTWQQFGITTESFSGELRYTVDPQGAPSTEGTTPTPADPGKVAWEKFPEGTTGYLFEAPGIDTDADLAVGDFGIPIPVEFGPRYITGDPTNEFAEFAVVQGIIVTAPGAGDLVAIVA
jgi:hypothetical protein